jgi:hypothetical protein
MTSASRTQEAGLDRLLFPFWIVTQRRGLISKPVEPDGMPGFVAAFSTAERASFMAGRGATEWENRLVARATLRELMADLRLLGMQGLCLDPAKGEGGTKIAFDEVVAS